MLHHLKLSQAETRIKKLDKNQPKSSMLQVVTENKSQKEVLFRNRPQRRQVEMVEDGKKILTDVQWSFGTDLNMRDANAHG